MFDKSYRTIRKNGQSEIEIKKSKFICSIARVSSEDEAKEFLQVIQKEHWKANHHCFATILGKNSEIQRFSDDGEPTGTAGIPMLEVLKKNPLVNVVAVVTRYFGGTKLGAGGLIRAYTHSVSQAIQKIGIIEKKLQQEIFVKINYAQLGKLQHFLEQNKYVIKETTFLADVTLCVIVDNFEDFEKELIELLNGNVTLTKGEKVFVEKIVT